MALPSHLALEIVTPDRSIVHEKVDEVEIPGVGRLLRRAAGAHAAARLAAGRAAVVPQGGRERRTCRWPSASPRCCRTA